MQEKQGFQRLEIHPIGSHLVPRLPSIFPICTKWGGKWGGKWGKSKAKGVLCEED